MNAHIKEVHDGLCGPITPVDQQWACPGRGGLVCSIIQYLSLCVSAPRPSALALFFFFFQIFSLNLTGEIIERQKKWAV